MQSRRDQVQSYQFLIQRVISAFVMRETDPLTPPFRRFVIAGFASFIVASLVIAGFGIYGLLRPGGKESWRDGSRVILERETGAQYIFREGRLYRLANYTSGLLLLGGDKGTVTVTRSSLLDIPRGPEIGIPGAPNGLPPAKNLLTTPWTLCSRIVTDESGTELPATVLIIGDRARGGTMLSDEGFLAENIETQELYLVWNRHRFKITDQQAALAGLALNQEPRVRVGSAWINAIPAGVDLAPLNIPNRGQQSKFNNARIGELFVVNTTGNTKQYYVAVADGLMPLTEVQFSLLFASKATEAAYPNGVPTEPPSIRSSDAAAAALPGTPSSGPEQLPREQPRMTELATSDAVSCGSFTDVESAPTMSIGADLPVTNAELVTARRTRIGTVIADRVLMAPGRGTIVEAVQGDQSRGVVHLITEQGVRYPLRSPKVLGTLGYSESDIVRLPAELVARVAEGAVLDPDAAGTILLQN